MALILMFIRCQLKSITVARPVVLKVMYKTTVLVSTEAKDLIEVALHEAVPKNHACMTAQGIINVYKDRLFCITIANFGMGNVHLPKHRKIGKVASVPEAIVNIKGERFLYPLGAKATKCDSVMNPVLQHPTTNRLEMMAELEAVKEKYKAILKKDCREDVQLPAQFKDQRLAFLEVL